PHATTTLFFSTACTVDHRALHSFPTRRSSDLKIEQTGADPYTFQIQSTGKIDGQERIVTKSFTVNYRKGGSSFLDLPDGVAGIRSEEHTSELQSRENLVCRLLLEKKKEQRTRR